MNPEIQDNDDDNSEPAVPWESVDPNESDRASGAADSTSGVVDSPSTGGWTVSVLSIGLAIVAACVLIPQADANRRLMYERDNLRTDLLQIQKQAAVNKEFLVKVETDPQLSERLALRQMRVVPVGERVLEVKPDDSDAQGPPMAGTADTGAAQMSPFMIVHVPPPPPVAPYSPIGGFLGEICLQPRGQLYLLGAGLFLIAVGLVLGDSSKPPATA